MTYKTKGIILKHLNFGESDKLVTILTESHGKIIATARGLRKLHSKLAGHLEPLCLSDLVLARGQKLDTIIGAVLINDFPIIKKDFSQTKEAFHIFELIDLLIKEDDPSEKIFELALTFLRNLSKIPNPLLREYFKLNLLQELGHCPEFNACVKCRSKLRPAINYFSLGLGGILCKNCRRHDLSSFKISDNAIKVMRLLLSNDFSILSKFSFNKSLINEVGLCVDIFIKEISD